MHHILMSGTIYLCISSKTLACLESWLAVGEPFSFSGGLKTTDSCMFVPVIICKQKSSCVHKLLPRDQKQLLITGRHTIWNWSDWQHLEKHVHKRFKWKHVISIGRNIYMHALGRGVFDKRKTNWHLFLHDRNGKNRGMETNWHLFLRDSDVKNLWWKQIGICFYMKAVKNCVMKTNWHFYINAMEKLCDGIDLLMLYVFCQHVQVAKVDVINE